jgi:hypothetical protein
VGNNIETSDEANIFVVEWQNYRKYTINTKYVEKSIGIW